MENAVSTLTEKESVENQEIVDKLCNATLVERVEITPDLLILKVKPDFEIPDFLPGQYVALGLPGCAPKRAGAADDLKPVKADKLIKRAYSIGSSPHEKGAIEFFLAIVEDGTLTPRLALLNEGDRLFCAKKFTGHFTLKDVPGDRNLILVATGTGLAPFISMLRNEETWTEGRTITVLHGVRYGKDLAYKEELSKYIETGKVKYFPVVSREEVDGATKGYVQHLFSGGAVSLDASRDHVFVCGNPSMIEEVEQLLVNGHGFKVHTRKEAGNLHYEKYW